MKSRSTTDILATLTLIAVASQLIGCGSRGLTSQDPVTAKAVYDGSYSLSSTTCPTASPALVITEGAVAGHPEIDLSADLAKPYEQRSYKFESGLLVIPETGCESLYRRG